MFGDRPSLLNDPNHFVNIQKKRQKKLRHIFRLTIVRLKRRRRLRSQSWATGCKSMTSLTNSIRLIISATTREPILCLLYRQNWSRRGSLIGWGFQTPTNGAARLQAASGPATVPTNPLKTGTNSLGLGQTQALGPKQGCIVQTRLGST